MEISNVEKDQEETIIPLSKKQSQNAVIITANITDSEKTPELDASEICFDMEQSTPKLEVTPKKLLGTRFYKAFNSCYVLTVLKDPIYFYGTVRFKLISGEMEVYGYRAPVNKEYELFSTRGCSSICLKPMTVNQNIVCNLEQLLQQHHLQFDAETLADIRKTYNTRFHALVLLRRNEERERMILHYKRYMNENIFPNISTFQAKNALQECEQFLDCHINKQSQQALKMPDAWEKLSLTNNNRLILVGGKAVGKSTLLRVLLNRHLSSNELAQKTGVLLIDLDVAQAELSAPQMISCTLMHTPLLGPGFFFNKATDFSYYVGEINVTLCVQRYLHAVKLLAEKCYATEAYQNVPWLINTMGYNQGIGTELIAAICELMKPTDVVQIQSNVPINNFPKPLEPDLLRSMLHELDDCSTLETNSQLENYVVSDYRLHLLSAAVSRESRYQQEWYMSAKDLRYANFLAQMSDILLDHGSFLVDAIPWCAALSKIKVISLNDPYKTTSELQQALTANVVYLCQHIEGEQATMQCFGIGIVRSVDEDHIYIMPVTRQNMPQVNCVVLSEQPLPTANLKRQGTRVKNSTLPFVYTTNEHASTAVKQMYRRPNHFLTTKHREFI